MEIDSSKIKTVSQFLEITPSLTSGQFKSWIFDERRFGLRAAGAVFKIGKKLFVNPEKFNEWLAARIQAQQKAL